MIQPFAGDTSIFITPGYRFRAVDILLTNFHLPRSTLFMLVSAFTGLDAMKQAYAPRDPDRLPVLFVWRCLPAVSRQRLKRRMGSSDIAIYNCECQNSVIRLGVVHFGVS